MSNYGLIGYPLENSMSSLIHSYFLAGAGISAGYGTFELKEPDELPILMNFLERFGFKGLNIAAPHKYKVTQFLFDTSESARRAGVANTLKLGRDGWVGYNTDIYGFARLMELEGVKPEGKDVMLFGAGGTAAAVICALMDRGVKTVTLVSRKEDRVHGLRKQFPDMELKYYHYDSLREGICVDIVINAIPVDWGNKMWRDRFWPDHIAAFKDCVPEFAIDLQYSPWETNFLILWEGSRRVNGYHMLAEQSAMAFEIWHGVKPVWEPIALQDAVRSAIGKL